MQGYMRRISTLGGKTPLVKGKQAAKDIKNGSAWLDMRQARAIWLKRNVRGASIKLMIMHSQLDIRGVRGDTGQHKIKRSMRLFLNVMEIL